jgi:hypothetical protein
MADRPPVLIKVLTATLTLLRNHQLVGNDPAIALSDAMDMLERWDHRGEELRTTPMVEKQLTDRPATGCGHYASPAGKVLGMCLNCGHPPHLHPPPPRTVTFVNKEVIQFGSVLQSNKPGQVVSVPVMTTHDDQPRCHLHPEAEYGCRKCIELDVAGWQSAVLSNDAQCAARYRWVREHPAFETEALLAGLTPGEFDALVDRRMGNG